MQSLIINATKLHRLFVSRSVRLHGFIIVSVILTVLMSFPILLMDIKSKLCVGKEEKEENEDDEEEDDDDDDDDDDGVSSRLHKIK